MSYYNNAKTAFLHTLSTDERVIFDSVVNNASVNLHRDLYDISLMSSKNMSKGNRVITKFIQIINTMENKEFDLWVILSVMEKLSGNELNQNQLERLFNAYHNGSIDLWNSSIGNTIIKINKFLMK